MEITEQAVYGCKQVVAMLVTSTSAMNFERIFVRSTNWLGDAIISIPALAALRERYPAAFIAIGARTSIADVYAHQPFCDEVIRYDAPKGWKGLGDKWHFAQQLRQRRFDCAILLQNAFEAAAIARAAGIPVRIGYDRDARAWLLTHPIAVPKPGEIHPHQRFYYLELLKRARVIESYSAQAPIRLTVPNGGAADGKRRFVALGLGEHVIGVNPGAAFGGAKRWLPERFAEAAVRIARERGSAVAVFGTPSEKAICQSVYSRIQAAGIKCANLAGETSLEEFLQLTAACEICLVNDSGAMHVSCAFDVPTIAIFGPTNEHETGPVSEVARVVRKQVECSPCLLRECPIDHRCMTRVTSDEVVDAAFTVLNPVHE